MSKLTAKQETFCLLYVKTNEASTAYKQAYDSNAKPAVISNNAYVLLQKPQVKKRIAQLKSKLEKSTILSAQQVLERLSELASKKSLSTRDRIRALELLGKHRKLFTEKVEVKGQDGTAIVVASLSERLRSARERSRTASERRASLN